MSGNDRLERALLNVAKGVSATTGAEFFRSLVEHLAKAIDVRYAFVSELAGPGNERLRLIAYWTGDGHGEPFEYDVAGTPCESVIGKGPAHYAAGVSRLFPRDRWLEEAGIESYSAVPLFGVSGEPVGHLGVLNDAPIPGDISVGAILTIFAARTGAELHRMQAEAARRELEVQVQQSQRLESLAVLAGGIAHDFNNLLTVILGNSSLALADLPEGSRVRERVVSLEKAALRAADLTRQMLVYSGRGQIDRAPLDLNCLAGEMKDLLSAAISRKAEFRLDFARDLPAVDADATQIRQIIMNLITNASDALDGMEGTITVRTGALEAGIGCCPGEPGRGPCVYLEVEDTGIGMDANTRERMFDPFFTTKFTGRGLGLASVLGIVRGHGGGIEVRSEPGSGTLMRVVFPATDRRAETAEAPVARADWRGSGTVLVVDDEADVREVARAMLEERGFGVLEAGGGREGIEVFERERGRIALVLLDLTMPDLDGEAVAEGIRRIDPAARVVLMSGYSVRPPARRGAGPRPSGFLVKPFRRVDLIEALRESLEGGEGPAASPGGAGRVRGPGRSPDSPA